MNEHLRTSPAGRAIIKHYETLHDGDLKTPGLQPQLCPTGWWTVGYGHRVIDPATKRPISYKTPGGKARALQLFPALTTADADKLLQQDCCAREHTLYRRITVPLNQHQFDALLSLEYNVGAISQDSTIRKHINAGRWDAAANEFPKWNKGRDENGKLVELRGLTRRRATEQGLFQRNELKFPL